MEYANNLISVFLNLAKDDKLWKTKISRLQTAFDPKTLGFTSMQETTT